MVDLVQWLRAQLDADEKVVQDGLCVNCGNPTVPLESPLGVTGYTHEGGWEGRRCPGRLVGAERMQNPARVLREIDAKRRIVALWKETDEAARSDQRYAESYDTSADGFTAGREDSLDDVLRLLASVYADREGYQESWRP